MGAEVAGRLSLAEDEAFYAGLKAHGRNFTAIHHEHLPARGVGELVSYYYDVWKLKASAQAERFFREREEVSGWAGWV